MVFSLGVLLDVLNIAIRAARAGQREPKVLPVDRNGPSEKDGAGKQWRLDSRLLFEVDLHRGRVVEVQR